LKLLARHERSSLYVRSVSDEEEESVSNVDDRKRKKVEVNPEHAGEEEEKAENRSQVTFP